MKTEIHSIIVVIFLSLCLGCSGSSGFTKYNHKTRVKAKLSDNQILHITFTLYFKDSKGVREIKKTEGQFKYAIAMVAERQKASLFSRKARGETVINNMIGSIAQQLLKEEVTAIKIIDYYIS